MALVVGISLCVALAIPLPRAASVPASQSGALSTLSIFYTESDYDPASRRWVGRVQKLEATHPERP